MDVGGGGVVEESGGTGDEAAVEEVLGLDTHHSHRGGAGKELDREPFHLGQRQIAMTANRGSVDARRRRFEAVFAEVYEPVQRYVRRRVDSGSVDDLVSETMLTVWRRLDDVPTEAVLPWVYGVARRQIANHRRSAVRRLRLDRRVEAEPVNPSESDHPLDAELHTALQSLDEADRELLQLWAWEQLDPAEIAVVLGTTPNAILIRLHRAKARLGQKLEIARKSEVLSGHSHRIRKEEGS